MKGRKGGTALFYILRADPKLTLVWRDINEDMQIDGTYCDPVGGAEEKRENSVVEKGGTAHKSWLQAEVLPLRTLERLVRPSVAVRVGGHFLYGGTGTRTITVTSPDKVKIEWPPPP